MTKVQLYPYQAKEALHLSAQLTKYKAVLDASDTGTGKTYTALGAARHLNQQPLVVCPKSVQSAWRQVGKDLGVPLLDVVNIEKLKAGNTPHLKKNGKTFVWTLPRGTLILWDEIQSASGFRSQNGKVLALTKAYGLPVLGMSATAADTPLKMKALGYLLGLHHYQDHYSWCCQNGCCKGRWGGLEFTKSAQIAAGHMLNIHKHIFPERGTRVRIDELDVFPDNAIFPEAYDLDRGSEEARRIYAQMTDELKDPDSNDNPLTIQLRARQQVELLKVPLMKNMIVDLLDEGKSIAVFISFRETMSQLTEALNGSHVFSDNRSLIFGGQKKEERDREIAEFQSDENRVCIAMIQAGGVGISLHDLNGNHPRVSLITPGYNAVELKQALGRIHRAGGKTKCIQRILFAAGTVEEEACISVRKKLKNIAILNDGSSLTDDDLTAGII